MKVVTVLLEYKRAAGVYRKLLNVFKKSLEVHTRCELVILNPPPPPMNHRRHQGLASNTVKLGLWYDFLLKHPGENIALMDCDLLIREDFSEVFKKKFDIAYTIRNFGLPFNLGVMFVRSNPRTLAFFKKWVEINEKMYHDPKFHKPYEEKFGAMNQAAFGWMLENYKDEIKLKTLPCRIYNSSHSKDWRRSGAKIVHIKGKLRKACLSKKQSVNTRLRRRHRARKRTPALLTFQKIVDEWKSYA